MNITPRNFKPVLSTILSSVPPPSSGNYTSRPPPASPMRPSPITKSRKSPVIPPNNFNLCPAPVELEK
ncbi:hypothetical protein O181_065798 [Austropuccinia psidii MF-1]|uniref:Uncharacterized protein n=1 Tax=Austropuccinia psidii MF-1 TaxID=1389203 RepID=A0A9Q3EQ95_9BASI|nr:hypothetical protein [Austropuccinia psidii MF-1]